MNPLHPKGTLARRLRIVLHLLRNKPKRQKGAPRDAGHAVELCRIVPVDERTVEVGYGGEGEWKRLWYLTLFL